MNRYGTLAGIFVALFALTVGIAAVGGLVTSDGHPDQAEIATDQWQLDNVAQDGADEGGEITMESDESTNTVVIHVGSPASTGPALPGNIPLGGSDRAVTTGSPAGLERSVDALASTLVANGHEVEFYQPGAGASPVSQQQTLATALSDADAFVTIAPSALSPPDRDAVTTFAEEGGRVFLGAAPGQVEGVLDISSESGIYQQTGFLYNVVENDQNYLSIYAEPAGSSALTDGVERVVFRGAAPVGQSEGSSALVTGPETELTTTQRNGSFGVAAIDGNLAVVGDTSFLSSDDAYRADNNVLVGNIADFLVTGEVSENPFGGQQGSGMPGNGGFQPPGSPGNGTGTGTSP